MLINILRFFGLAFWVEIITDSPRCTYYFGPFLTEKEANDSKSGYIEDLENEGAQGIIVAVKRCKPENLTIDYDLGESREPEKITTLSGQPS